MIIGYSEPTLLERADPVIRYFSDFYWIGDFLCLGWLGLTVVTVLAFHFGSDTDPSNP